ncbi:MAG: tRNA pseudouridine(38-40) synthase TruA [Gammaproteobacteria bacterium]|jgi:tRNA pseudouridine38-40 synthase|nr:tRNA pseudouridine(38-40) synthase TruA [Gammaproteobacteria bacterium]
MRFALGVEYDGSDFSGWESQPRQRTVQSTLETALAFVADDPVATVCAGRTDAGVHALAQVVHFDAQVQRAPHEWVLGANSNLPGDVSVRWANPVAELFHARYSAVRRYYRYVIQNRRERSALLRQRAAWERSPLEVAAMGAAAEYLVGEQDFSSFRAAGCQAKSAVRNVVHLEVHRRGDLVFIDIAANAFLQHMVRNVAGVLIEIGKGKREPAWAGELIEARDRTRGAATAPPQGLYLSRIDYPPEHDLPAVSPEWLLW